MPAAPFRKHHHYPRSNRIKDASAHGKELLLKSEEFGCDCYVKDYGFLTAYMRIYFIWFKINFVFCFYFRYSSSTGRRLQCPLGGGKRAAFRPQQSSVKYAPAPDSGKHPLYNKWKPVIFTFDNCVTKFMVVIRRDTQPAVNLYCGRRRIVV